MTGNGQSHGNGNGEGRLYKLIEKSLQMQAAMAASIAGIGHRLTALTHQVGELVKSIKGRK